MMERKRLKIEYDNRFGFGKTCTAYWIFDANRVGEQFIFVFPNGIKVSVIRSTAWDYYCTAKLLSTSASEGFTLGKYEALVWDQDGNEVEQVGYLDHNEVRQLLGIWRNHKS